jgi:DNA topoisomerase-1
MNLLIVESPKKATTIGQWLKNKNISVLATKGHFKDLKKSSYAINKNDKGQYSGEWEVDRKKISTLEKKIKQVIASKGIIFIGTDDDREGEKIAADVVEVFKLKKDQYFRILFREISEEAIINGIEHRTNLDNNRVESQIARRYIDRVAGYPMTEGCKHQLMKNFGYKYDDLKGYGIGRVSSAALFLIVSNARMVDEFIPKEYKKIFINYVRNGEEFTLTNNKKYYEENNEAFNLLYSVVASKRAVHLVEQIEEKQNEESPHKPLVTTRLCRVANYYFGYTPNQTMSVLKELHDGIQMGDVHVGLITYYRTDSYNISNKAIKNIIAENVSLFGWEKVVENKRKWSSRQNAQEAHEAIRPVFFGEEFRPTRLRRYFTPEQFYIYNLIYYRTLSTQLKNAVYDASTIKVDVEGYKFIGKSHSVIHEGWREFELLETGEHNSSDEQKEKIKSSFFADKEEVFIPKDIRVGEMLQRNEVEPKNGVDKTPPRYGVGRFMTTLEDENIGRPSTIPFIPYELIRKKLADVKDNMLIPTGLGIQTIKILEEYAPWIIDREKAGDFENELDAISQGKTDKNRIIEDFDRKKDEFLASLNCTQREEEPISERSLERIRKIATKIDTPIPEDAYKKEKAARDFIRKYDKSTKMGNCPECNNYVLENQTSFYCKNPKCTFQIWKNTAVSFFGNKGKEVKSMQLKNIMIHMLRNKKAFIEHFYSTKSKNEYDAFVVFKKEESRNKKIYWKFALEFPNSDSEKHDPRYKVDVFDVKPSHPMQHLAKSENISVAIENIELKRQLEEKANTERRLIDAVEKDNLTRAFTLRKLQDDVKRIWSNGQEKELSAAFLDIDHFKSVNDTYGHEAGDIVLKSFSDTIHEQIRDKSGYSLYRIGGEEFLLLAFDSYKYIFDKLEDIRKAVENKSINYNPAEQDKKYLNITVSIGLSKHKNNQSFDDLRKEADNNMYKAKDSGRNQIVTDELNTTEKTSEESFNQEDYYSGYTEDSSIEYYEEDYAEVGSEDTDSKEKEFNPDDEKEFFF